MGAWCGRVSYRLGGSASFVRNLHVCRPSDSNVSSNLPTLVQSSEIEMVVMRRTVAGYTHVWALGCVRPESIIEPSAIQHYLSTHTAGWTDIAVTAVDVIGQGWESEILSLACELPTGPLDLVLRMYTGSGGSEKAAVEGVGLPKLFAAGYPVPQVFHAETSPKPLGLPFIIMERVPGTELWQYLDLSTGQAARTLEVEFIDLMVELHQVPSTPFDPEDQPADPHHFIRRTLDTWREVAAAAGPADIEHALSWFEQEIPRVEPLSPCVTHNDFHPGNIMRDDTGQMTVIDWTGLAVTDPRFDLAWTLLLRETYGAPGASDRERKRYASQLPIPDLEFFEAASRLRRLFSLIVSLTAGPEALGMRAGAETQMRQELQQSAGSYKRFTDITSLRLPSYEELADS